MSRYPPPEYRNGPRDRSRSPPRFSDRRPSAAAVFEGRGPPRNAAGAPRGPRSQLDGPPRPPLSSNLGPGPGPGPGSRPGYSSLRDAPPLGADRGRGFRERDYERRDRLPSPRERSPPRGFNDPREFPPCELDIPRARRASRDGPPSAGSNFSDKLPFAPAPFRGGFGRGRGRGDFGFRGGRGGRREFDDRDREPARRERSPPPPRWGRDHSRDEREPERRDERRPFDRREEERRPDWPDREREVDRRADWLEREREIDRARRDQPQPRLEARRSNESVGSGPPPQQAPPALQIDPGRLALLEQAGADVSVRRPSMSQNVPPPREARRDVHETPAYLNGRAETTANRYKQRDSSPPTQAPPVPAFTLSFAPSAPASSAVNTAPLPGVTKPPQETKETATQGRNQHQNTEPPNEKAEPPVAAPTAPAPPPPPAPKADLAEPPPTAPRAPRAHDPDGSSDFGARLQGVRSLENLHPSNSSLAIPVAPKASLSARPSPTGPTALSAAAPVPNLPTLIQPVSPNVQQSARFGDLSAPTGPRASRMSPAQSSVSPRPPFASPRSDVGGFPGFSAFSRGQTPPPAAPSGPRNRSFSVSPKVSSSTVPTAPKAIRAPLAPRGVERGPGGFGRGQDRLGPPPPWAPPTAPKGLQWNQWRRTGASLYGDKTIPAKRDFAGEEKECPAENSGRQEASEPDGGLPARSEPIITNEMASALAKTSTDKSTLEVKDEEDRMELDREASRPSSKPPAVTDHSAAQSFFGKPAEMVEDEPSMSDAQEEPISSSEEDEIDAAQDLALFNAKFERRKRALEAQMVDLSAREYRATTPLESIARLSRISEKDLQRVREHHEHEMDLDESPTTVNNHLMPPATHSSGSDEAPDLLTPKGEDETVVEVRSSGDSSENVRRVRRPSPEIISLPYLIKEPHAFQDHDTFQQTVQRQEESRVAVLAALEQETEKQLEDEEDAEDGFQEACRQWREENEALDRLREEQEQIERQRSAEPGPETAAPAAAPLNPIAEGRRLHKYSSEYDVEQVLKQSEEMARLEQERQDRETRKLQADMEKEAKVSDQQPGDSFRRSVFIDANRYRDPETLTMVYSYEPQPDTFTEKEQQIFIAAFKETPKKWGEIASLLPGRNYRDCIHHYYANKWDGRFRDRTKKLKGGRGRGRGARAPMRGRGSAAMADLGTNEELMPVGVSESGRPRRAAAPTTFGEREAESKAALAGPSPAKKLGPVANGEVSSEKPVKRRKGMGEKPGRKAKATQPLAALAAAPSASPNRQLLQPMHTKDEVARAQSLEDANLLASLQSGHTTVLRAESQAVYNQEAYASSMLPVEDLAPAKAISQSAGSRSGASSYWSVPEQQDFVKYIGHFGTDFAAISKHMGTKTQVMIKNHYQRQVGSGTQPELESSAREADRKREIGEELGPPPTPTPIVKRKYDQPQATAPRPLAPNTEPMEVDELPVVPSRGSLQKPASPPQYQAQPRFTSSAQATPIPAQRVVPSPVPSTASPATSQAQAAAPARPMQHPLGARLSFMTDTRPESRPSLPTTSAFRLSQEGVPRSQPQQSTQVPDPSYIRNLVLEQERAFQVQMQEQQRDRQRQEEHRQQDRVDQFQRQTPFQRGSAQGSPADRPLPNPPMERMPLLEERAPTPPRGHFGQSPFHRPPFGPPALGPFGPSSLSSSLLGRPPLHPSSPKKEEQRPSSVPVIPPMQPPMASAPPPPEPPKRSNLLSILNSEPEEPKPSKRESLPSIPPRNHSPAPHNLSSAPTPAPGSNVPPRREMFGQPSMPQSQLHRSSFAQQGQPLAATPSTIKQEPSSAAGLSMQGPKPDWAARVLGQPAQAAAKGQPSPPTLERDVRPYYSHRASALGPLNQPARANPSPPPHTVIGHSRTPSLTTQPNQPPRDQRQGMQSQQQQGLHAHMQPLHSNPYAQQTTSTPFPPPPPPPREHNHAHHSHNSSLTGGFPGLHSRAQSRDEAFRQEQQRHEQQAFAAQHREREEYEWRRRDDMQREAQYHAQREQDERERQQQRVFGRGPPPPPQPLHPPAYAGPTSAMGQGRPSVGLRDQAMRETEAAIRQEQERQMHEEAERRHREGNMMRDRELEERRRHEEALYRRGTPLGGYGFGHPPPRR